MEINDYSSSKIRDKYISNRLNKKNPNPPNSEMINDAEKRLNHAFGMLRTLQVFAEEILSER